ncbi:MAG: hypothetical protein Q8920_16600 [Bacillota bacterium]|nr:hypothetical protein [Bacillota bacterium]
MSYQEKRTITEIFSALLILIAYGLYIINRFHAHTINMQELKPWASAMLIFVGLGIIATIIIQILFHILLSISIAVKESVAGKDKGQDINKAIANSMVGDEMHKLIELKSSRMSTFFYGFGFIAALVSIVLSSPLPVMLNILFGSWLLGWIFEGSVRLIYYRKGVRNG